MTQSGLTVLATAAMVGLVSVAIHAGQATAPRSAAAASTIARGKYLVDTGGCHDCHTPKKMGANGPELETTTLLSGHVTTPPLPAPPKLPDGPWAAVMTWDLTAWSGPWGISYAVNLTPDPETGIGGWTQQIFVSAIRNGKHMGSGRPILPPMPWETIRNLTDEDLKAMFAYLRSLPPVKNRVPAPAPPGK
jgi:mono/diheme cytochrome c family protein